MTGEGDRLRRAGAGVWSRYSAVWGMSLPAIERCLIVRPYLVSARNHGRRPLDAIPDALNGTAWRPPRKTATALAA